VKADRRAGLAALVLGAGLILAVQRVAPSLTPPLYDGVVVVEPYRWLVPPAGQPGDAKSAAATAKPEGGASPLLALATPEQPPQAQLFASPGSLVLPAGTTSIKMSIAPILPQMLPAEGHIAGNVYRISVTDQAGTPLTAPASAKVTIVMRTPASEPFVTIEQAGLFGWKSLTTEDAGFGGTFLAVVTGFGDFALVGTGPGTGPYPTATPVGAASSGPPASAAGSGIGSSSPVVTPPGGGSSSAPSPAGGGGGSSLPIPAIAAAVAVVVLAAIGIGSLRERDRRKRRYRGARPRRR